MKYALVTGATRGIGKAIAKALLDQGFSVAITGHTEATVQAALSDLPTAIGHPADLGNPEEVATLFRFVESHFPHLDVLINNAGIGIYKPTADLTIADWQSTLNLNLNGVFYCCHEALPGFRKQGHGYIINISSLAGKNPFAGGAAYNASKFGLNGFSEAMMLDHRNEGLRVTTIMPGSVATNFGKTGPAPWKIAPEDIAEIVLSLLRMPERTTVSAIEVRPSKPNK